MKQLGMRLKGFVAALGVIVLVACGGSDDPANQAPSVALTAPADGSTATTGVALTLTATATDADGVVAGVTFFENDIQIGATDTAPPYSVVWTPARTGARRLTARAIDDDGTTTTSAIVDVTVNPPDPNNRAPVARIDAPVVGTSFRAGVAITFGGSATDAEDGALAASRLTWRADLHHASHTHPLRPETTGAGGTVTFETRGHTEDDIFIRFHLRATDSGGRSHEVTRDVQPQKVQLTFTTSPAGLALSLDGQPVTGPHTVTGVVGVERDLVAAATQNSSGANPRRYQFQRWSDGQSATHTIATPAADTTYTATYQDVGPATNTPPAVALTTPSNNATVTQGVEIQLAATATDADGNTTIAGVEFFENGTKIGSTDTTAPYRRNWTPATLGTRTLTARATDDQGATTTSAAVTVTVEAATGDAVPPIATLTAPADRAAGLGGTIALIATATDNVGVASVEFQVDGEPVGGGPDTTAPYGVPLVTDLYPSGQHVVRARARDAAGNVSAWSSATVEFDGSRTQPDGFTRNSAWTGALSSATAFAQAPDGRWFVAQQGGQLRIVEASGNLLPTPFMTLTVDDDGERGLLGVALHPDFATNRWVYLYYTTPENGVHNRISRYTTLASNQNIVDPGSELRIADLPGLSGATNHNGGAMHFGDDGKLYVAVGDNADSSKAPDLNDPFGKVLRFNPDATLSIPSDNPYCTTAATLRCAIWARGLRNPFTFAVRASDGRIHINDVGQGSWEEINLGVPGANYGWPATEGPTVAPGVTAPLYAYDHDSGSSGPAGFFNGCAITGGAFPRGTAFPAAYRNSYYFADYCSRFVARIDLGNGNAAYAFGAVGDAPVDMRFGNDGALYVLTRGGITRFAPP
jgi:glucose/arabinose dehydrogenase